MWVHAAGMRRPLNKAATTEVTGRFRRARRACRRKDSVLELTEHLLVSRVVALPLENWCARCPSYATSAAMPEPRLGAHAEAVRPRAAKSAACGFVQADGTRKISTMLQRPAVSAIGRLGQLIEVAGINRTARTSRN